MSTYTTVFLYVTGLYHTCTHAEFFLRCTWLVPRIHSQLQPRTCWHIRGRLAGAPLCRFWHRVFEHAIAAVDGPEGLCFTREKKEVLFKGRIKMCPNITLEF